MMKKLIEAVSRLAHNEYELASKQHGAKFHSMHEAYAIIKEEVEEAQEELISVNSRLFDFWSKNCRRDSTEIADDTLIALKSYAINAASECIQIAAMAHKALQGVEE